MIAYVGVALGVTVVMTASKMTEDLAIQGTIRRLLDKQEMDSEAGPEGRPKRKKRRR